VRVQSGWTVGTGYSLLNWGGFNSDVIVAGTTDLATPVDVDKSFLVFSGNGGQTDNWQDQLVEGYFQSTTKVRFVRDGNASGWQYQMMWWAVEAITPGIWDVQHLEYALTGTTTDEVIPAPVAPNRTMTVSNYRVDVASQASADACCIMQLIDKDTFRVNRTLSSGTLNVRTQIIESQWFDVQRGTLNWSANSTEVNVTLDHEISKAWSITYAPSYVGGGGGVIRPYGQGITPGTPTTADGLARFRLVHTSSFEYGLTRPKGDPVTGGVAKEGSFEAVEFQANPFAITTTTTTSTSTVTTTLPPLPTTTTTLPPCAGLEEDDFNDASINPRWILQEKRGGSFSESGGFLHVTAGPDGCNAIDPCIPTYIAQCELLDTEFDVWTKIVVPATTGLFQEFGLLFRTRAQTDVYAKVGGRIDGGNIYAFGLYSEVGTIDEEQQVLGAVSEIWVRMRRKFFTGAYRFSFYYATTEPVDTVDWTKFSTIDLAFSEDAECWVGHYTSYPGPPTTTTTTVTTTSTTTTTVITTTTTTVTTTSTTTTTTVPPTTTTTTTTTTTSTTGATTTTLPAGAWFDHFNDAAVTPPWTSAGAPPPTEAGTTVIFSGIGPCYYDLATPWTCGDIFMVQARIRNHPVNPSMIFELLDVPPGPVYPTLIEVWSDLGGTFIGYLDFGTGWNYWSGFAWVAGPPIPVGPPMPDNIYFRYELDCATVLGSFIITIYDCTGVPFFAPTTPVSCGVLGFVGPPIAAFNIGENTGGAIVNNYTEVDWFGMNMPFWPTCIPYTTTTTTTTSTTTSTPP